MDLRCFNCGRKPNEIDEYIAYGQMEGMTPDEYVLEEEGTLNSEGRFACTTCYVKIGMPTSPYGWKAP